MPRLLRRSSHRDRRPYRRTDERGALIEILFDHDVPDDVERLLVYWRHDTQRLRDVLPITVTDDDAFAFAQREQRIIITCNRNHFSKLARAATASRKFFCRSHHSDPSPSATGRMRAPSL